MRKILVGILWWSMLIFFGYMAFKVTIVPLLGFFVGSGVGYIEMKWKMRRAK